MSLLRTLALLLTAGALLDGAIAADAPPPSPVATSAQATRSRAVMTGEQVVRILDETVDWYRTLGAQQQSATQPSDLLILYANRQIADRAVGLAFQIARANAELLSSEAEVTRKAAADAASSPQALQRVKQQLDGRRAEIQAEIASTQRRLASAPKAQAAELQAKIAELQSELDLVNARRNLHDSMSQFIYQSDANGAGVNALKAHIDAIAVSIPSSGGGAGPVGAGAGSAPGPAATPTSSSPPSAGSDRNLGRLGIWDLAANVLRLADKIRTIDVVDGRTAALQDTFTKIRIAPQEQIKTLSARGDALADQADSSNGTALKGVRDQFDTLAWLFKQTADILLPLSQEGVLLDQYRRNLASWRSNTHGQYVDALKALGARLAILLALLAIVYIATEAWRRGVLRYVDEPRRRYQLLLARRIVFWVLVVGIVGFTFATELGSLATFAGLITAGVAVAMQSVLVSMVGYFFLIGKYGIRVGDRVQVGTVTGEVIDLGLVRLHLMELSGHGALGPTGRVVAFANSIVFQASGGIFKQIPGVNLAWHDITLTLPPKADPSAMKEKLLAAANQVLGEYSEDMARQTLEIQKTTSLHAGGKPQAQVQLRFSATGVEALVRYPVQLQRAAEIDERISRELLAVIMDAAA
ncbi:MAG TPA: mechanosensitive ion channel domain-containing protein [Casimicrobiaceae bacterium]|nr:mechanosensitive ion channel domain-containing protein [Casimicrobiaceae bacterium]